MQNLSNLDLINSYKDTKDNLYLSTLIEKNKSLIYKRMQHFKIRWNDHDDAYQGCLERILKCIDSYDPTRSKFSTFVYMLTTRECIAFINNSKRNGMVGKNNCWSSSLAKTSESYTPAFMMDPDKSEVPTSDLYWELDELKKAVETLSSEEQLLLDLSYKQKLSFVAIGKEFGITKQAVYQRLLGIQNKLKKRLENKI